MGPRTHKLLINTHETNNIPNITLPISSKIRNLYLEINIIKKVKTIFQENKLQKLDKITQLGLI